MTGDRATNASRSVPVVPDTLDGDVRRLGEALGERVEDVLELTASLSKPPPDEMDAATHESFAEIGRASTTAVARWMAGGSPEDGRTTSQKAFQTYGQLAAQRVTPLNEVTKRCLCWRDAVIDVLSESAARMGVSPEALSRAKAMVRHTLDVTLVRMTECFELERRRTDEELSRRQRELSFMATHDSLTGLPNRTLIVDRGEQALARARRHKTPVAALCIDIDNFKSVNDRLGRDAGDELLRAMGTRLAGVVRATDALGRLAGDEFMVIAEDLSLDAGPELIAERLLEALTQPVKLDRNETFVTVTASIGIAVGERSSAEELLRDADVAMYRAKWDGKNRYVVFESDMQEAVQSRMLLELDLREALGKQEFFLVYQPTFDLREMRPTGVEALIRWRHPARGVVQPNDFIPLLEESGLIEDVGRWVLIEACDQCARWRAAGHPVGIAVNVAGRQLDHDEFVADVERALSHSGLDPEALTLEITETTLMRNVDATSLRLAALKERGVRIAIDDFGTGYSSLAHLQRFPVDALKIDRSFIARLNENPEGATLIHTLVHLGKSLSIETIAEGIEHRQELILLQNEECDSGQGFLFARPLEVSAAETFLNDWNAVRALDQPRLADAMPRRAN